jgi:hypothetical protein
MRPALILWTGDKKELRRAEIPNAFRADSSRGRQEDHHWRGKFPEGKGWNPEGHCAKGPPLSTEQVGGFSIRRGLQCESRLPDTRSSSSDITPAGQAALRQLAVRVLTRHSGTGEGAETLATAARLAYDELSGVSTPLIGQVGVDALTARALHLAQREYPWLGDPAEESPHTNEPFARVIVNLGRQHPAIATEGTAAVFATLAGLLITFIGEPLTMALLRKAWPHAFFDARPRET